MTGQLFPFASTVIWPENCHLDLSNLFAPTKMINPIKKATRMWKILDGRSLVVLKGIRKSTTIMKKI